MRTLIIWGCILLCVLVGLLASEFINPRLSIPREVKKVQCTTGQIEVLVEDRQGASKWYKTEAACGR